MEHERLLTIDSRASALLIAVALVMMAVRVLSPLLYRAEGREMRRLAVPFSAKLRRQRSPLILLGMMTGANAVSGDFSLPLHLGALIVAGALLALPAKYVMTDQGIRAGWQPFRRWSEFAGLSVRRGTIRLQPLSGLAKLEITLPGRFEDADIVGEIRAQIRLGYQGSQQSNDGSEENGNPPLALA